MTAFLNRSLRLAAALASLTAVPALATGETPPTGTGTATIKLVKTVAGQAPSVNQSFRFELRAADHSVIAFNFADFSNAGHVQLATSVPIPGNYFICEVGLPAGWTTASWSHDQNGKFRPENEPNTECRPFNLWDPTNTFLFVFIDNIPGTPPPPPPPPPPSGSGPTRTIGYWKNWSSCSGGKQAPILDLTLASFSGGGPVFGTLRIDTCEEAHAILSKSTVGSPSRKRAGDAAYRLAAQLLGAMLNVNNAAITCGAATTSIDSGLQILAGVGFNGTGDFSGTINEAMADAVAEALDDYNNGNLCQ